MAKLSTIYDAICDSEFVEQLYQTEAKEIWFRAIAVLRQLHTEIPADGIVFTHNPKVLTGENLHTWLFNSASNSLLTDRFLDISDVEVVQLAEDDPIKTEQFYLLVTETFGVMILCDRTNHCWFTLHPDPIQRAVDVLRDRVTHPSQISLLESQLLKFPIAMPPYQVMAKFGSLLLAHSVSQEMVIPDIQEIDIIRALTHEVRTPLTTIRTLIRSLLRRIDISSGVKMRLESVDRECTEQIDRFNLIFEAAQLTAYPVPLGATFIVDILQQSLPRWQEQASRRQLSLNIRISEDIPAITSNAELLGQVLNGLIDRLTRSLPPGSQIQVLTTAAGDHIKLQFLSQLKHPTVNESQMLTAVGQWLMLQPETGSLSLSLPITKTLFQALGGKLTVRVNSTHSPLNHEALDQISGEVLTIFLPIHIN